MIVHHIAALGSSFAAGPGIEPIIDTIARRSSNNYAHLAAAALDAKLTDLTSSGATLLNVLSESQGFWLASSLVPQMELLPSDVDIVTLTAGGNDLGYSSGMILDAFKASLRDSLVLGRVLKATGLLDKRAHVGDVTFDQVEQRFLEIFDRIHAAAPKARIYLVQYLNVFGADTDVRSDQPLDKERSEYYRSIANNLAQTYRDTADQQKEFVQVAEMSDISKGHVLGSEEPWVTGFTTTMMFSGTVPYHPNAAGHGAVARELEQRIKDTTR
jgi:lysophospholipase L1-like esterase